jgi:hypothetical protein
VTDIAWFKPDGEEMTDDDWHQEHAKCFAVFLNGDALREVNDGKPIRDDSFLFLFNARMVSECRSRCLRRCLALLGAPLSTLLGIQRRAVGRLRRVSRSMSPAERPLS